MSARIAWLVDCLTLLHWPELIIWPACFLVVFTFVSRRQSFGAESHLAVHGTRAALTRMSCSVLSFETVVMENRGFNIFFVFRFSELFISAAGEKSVTHKHSSSVCISKWVFFYGAAYQKSQSGLFMLPKSTATIPGCLQLLEVLEIWRFLVHCA